MNISSLNEEAMQTQQSIELLKKAYQVLKFIPPMWSLENFVAVNPFLGMSDKSFNQVSSQLKKLSGAEINMPLDFYREAYKNNVIQASDIDDAINGSDIEGVEADEVRALLEDANYASKSDCSKLLLVVDLFSNESNFPWDEFVKDRISGFISIYLDKGQALWNTADRGLNLYESWLKDARQDLAPSIRGLKNYKSDILSLPNNHSDALIFSLKALHIADENMEHYLHGLLLRYGGWGSYIAGIDWDARLYGGKEDMLANYLSVLVVWEWLMMRSSLVPEISGAINDSVKKLLIEKDDHDFQMRIVLQNAFDWAAQRQLKENFSRIKTNTSINERPKAQGVFCIDVRSEVYRRNLESITPHFETLGFAGFFGFPINYKLLSQDYGSNQCPMLIPSGPQIHEAQNDTSKNKNITQRRKVLVHSSKIWKQFKNGSVSSFSFVSSLGLWFLPKLITDSMGITRPNTAPNSFGLNREELAQRTVDLSGISL